MIQRLFRISFLLVVLAGIGTLKAQTLKISDPIRYNDYIVNQQSRIGEELLKLIGMFDALPEDKAVCIDQLEVIIATCKSAIANLQNLATINHEFGMRDSAIELFQFYDVTMETDYRKVIDELYAEIPDMELLQSILTRIQEQEATSDKKFQGAQEQFAKYHNISLQENSLQEEFEEAGE
jgi:hypothetical protein